MNKFPKVVEQRTVRAQAFGVMDYDVTDVVTILHSSVFGLLIVYYCSSSLEPIADTWISTNYHLSREELFHSLRLEFEL